MTLNGAITVEPDSGKALSKVTVTANVPANVIAKSIKSWISLPATPSASASSVVTRDANGNVQVGMPVNDADAAPKSFVESNSSKVGTSAENNERLKAIYYTAEDGIPATPEGGVNIPLLDSLDILIWILTCRKK